MSGWENIADAAAAEYKSRGSLGTTAGRSYFAAVQAGWTGHMKLWVEEVRRRADGPPREKPARARREAAPAPASSTIEPPFNPFGDL